MNGEPAVFLSVLLQDGGRLADTTASAREVIAAVQGPRRDPGHALVLRASEDFQGRLDLMVRNGLSGLGLIFLVLFFTLSTRLAIWTAAGLPFTFFGAFLLMPGLGITVNLLSMFAFIVALGIVVDDAIVVGENVQRRMDDGGESREESAIRGTRRVLFPAAFGVLTTMAAFAPLLGIPGVYGELIGDLPRMVIPILAFSLLEAAWILPHHLAHGGLSVRPSRRLARIRGAVQSGFDGAVATVYRPALGWALDNRLATLALGVFRSLPSRSGSPPGGFVQVVTGSPMDNNIAFVQVKLPAEATSDATRAVVASLERHGGRGARGDSRRVGSGCRASPGGPRGTADSDRGRGGPSAGSPRRWARPSARSSGGSAPRKTARESRRAPSRTGSGSGFERSRWTRGCP